jgi:hypothetical protein
MSFRKSRWGLALVIAAAAAGAIAQQQAGHGEGEQAANPRNGAVRESLKTPAPRVPLRNLNDMIGKARADLAMRIGANAAEITTVGWKAVRLPARVLRCEVAKGDAGEPDVPGYRIVLSYKAREYTYQSDTQSVTACPRIERN